MMGWYAQIETHVQLSQNILDPSSIPHIGAPQIPTVKLSPATRFCLKEKATGDKVINAIMPIHWEPQEKPGKSEYFLTVDPLFISRMSRFAKILTALIFFVFLLMESYYLPRDT